ncbi:MAG: DUF2510 domain-containing protein [Clostridiales Family XIII bacterium]|jgi:hypothetical protein|nr:DUF2510 domain-containing protein [Clostridiales Family XIII bacterium]
MEPDSPSSGWYADAGGMLRYWDGSGWTDAVLLAPGLNADGAGAGGASGPRAGGGVGTVWEADKAAALSRTLGVLGILSAWVFVPAGFVLALLALYKSRVGMAGSCPEEAAAGRELGISALVCSVASAAILSFLSIIFPTHGMLSWFFVVYLFTH